MNPEGRRLSALWKAKRFLVAGIGPAILPPMSRDRPPIDPIWYLIGFVLVAFLAGLAIKFYRTGVIYP